jgi:type II secretion system (T2SS) protein G
VSEPAPARSKVGAVGRSALRVALAVAAILAVVVVGAVAYGWNKFQRAGASSPRTQVILLRQATMQLLADGFAGCPTVQQVLELSAEPSRTELRKETTGLDPWGAPFQVQCDREHVRVFSMGPDKLPGTTDDIGSTQ